MKRQLEQLENPFPRWLTHAAGKFRWLSPGSSAWPAGGRTVVPFHIASPQAATACFLMTW